jgi:hypothetical protein
MARTKRLRASAFSCYKDRQDADVSRYFFFLMRMSRAKFSKDGVIQYVDQSTRVKFYDYHVLL